MVNGTVYVAALQRLYKSETHGVDGKYCKKVKRIKDNRMVIKMLLPCDFKQNSSLFVNREVSAPFCHRHRKAKKKKNTLHLTSL